MPATNEQDGGSPGVGEGAVQQSHVEQVPVFEEGVRTIANFQFSPPDKFSCRQEDWPKWIERFERFLKATGLDKRSGENQVNTLSYTMGEQADDVFISFELTTEQEKNYAEVKEKIENYFIVKRNVIFERAKFNSRNQREGESVDSLITELNGLARYCNFGALKDEPIRDRIVVGVRNRDVSEKLQLDPKLTWKKLSI